MVGKNPVWVQDQLRRKWLVISTVPMAGKNPLRVQDHVSRKLLVRSTEPKDEELCVAEKSAKEIHQKLEEVEEEEEVEACKLLFHSYTQQQKLNEDIALVALLKTCAKEKDLCKGSKIHADILNNGLLENNLFICNTLVNMYAKCGALAKAQQVFEELPVRDVTSWNALIAGYAQHRHGEKALNCFKCMQHEGLFPNAVTFVSIMKACGSIRAIEQGEEIHVEIARKGLLGHGSILGNAILDMYAKCGALAKAQQVFDELPVRNVVSWTALIAGYCQHGHGEEALKCFDQMKTEGLVPNAVTFACVLKACGSIRAAEMGTEIHTDIARKGLLGNGIVLANSLVDMYSKCGALAKAQEVFDQLPTRDVVSWTALIAGYSQHGHGEKALNYFEHMKHEGIFPNAMTFACIVQTCGSIRTAEKGKELHAEIVQRGFFGEDPVLGNALVDMYVKCGALAKAQQVFDKLPVQDVVSWSALIAGYCQYGHGEEAVNCLERMKHKGLSPDAVTFVCILQACGTIGAAVKGIEIHADIARKALLGSNVVLGSALVDMYVKCGSIARAQEVFDELPVRNLVSWSVLISGYCVQGLGEKALKCFERMKGEGLFPDGVTLACVLKACSSVGAVEKGVEIHIEIVRMGLLGSDTVLGSALVDMYAKCGVLAKAAEVFDKLSVRDVVSWSALITGYSEHGYGEEALKCFERMKHQGISPDAVAFACILDACGSIGASDKGQMYFEFMSTGHGIIPCLEHHACMVSLYGRIGQLDKAISLVKKMPSSYYAPAWRSLLGACQKWGNVKLGRMVFEYAVQFDEKSVSPYVCMSDISAGAGVQDDARNIEAKRENFEGCWWANCCDVHSFLDGIGKANLTVES